MELIRDGYCFLLPSGRGVRVMELFPSEKDQVLKNVAALLDKDALAMDFHVASMREGVMSMIKYVTDGYAFKKQEELLDPNVKWNKVSKQELLVSYDKLFSAKDDAVLCAVYKKLHDVDSDEIEAIAGKMLPVSGI